MTDSEIVKLATPMTRRRRNLLIGVTAVVALFAFWQWWNWPRIDERLVGTWEHRFPPNVGRGDERFSFRLRADGFVDDFHWLIDRTSSGMLSGRQQWSVRDGELILRPAPVSFSGNSAGVREWIDHAYARLTRANEWRFKIDRLSDGLLRIHPTKLRPGETRFFISTYHRVSN